MHERYLNQKKKKKWEALKINLRLYTERYHVRHWKVKTLPFKLELNIKSS